MGKGSRLESRLQDFFAEGNEPPAPDGLEQRALSRVFEGAPRRRTSIAGQLVAVVGLIALAIGVGIALRTAHTRTPVTRVTPTPVPSATASGPVGFTPQFQSIHMITEQTGWAVSDRGILRTTDGGLQWHNVTPAWAASSDAFRIPYFMDGTRAWLASSDRMSKQPSGIVTIGWTLDGGQTWQRSGPLAVPGNGWPWQLVFVDNAHGWLFVDLGAAMSSSADAIYQTIDGGRHWTEVSYTPFEGDPWPGSLPRGCDKNGVSFIDTRTGWAAGSCVSPDQFFYVTHDGGRTWQSQPLTTPGFQLGEGAGPDLPTFMSGTSGVMTAELSDAQGRQQIVVFVTTDAGKSWQSRLARAPATRDQAGVFVALGMHDWWVVARNGSVVERTGDGGAHWREDRTNLPYADVFSVNFLSPSVGYAVGSPVTTPPSPDDNTACCRPIPGLSRSLHAPPYQASPIVLYKTLDGGKTWQLVPATELPPAGPTAVD